jgi:hypothetical protein
VRIDGITAVARCSSDMRGLLSMDDASPELTAISLDIDVDSPDPAGKTGPMLDAWRERCPIYLALLRPNEIELHAAVRGAV